MSPPRSRLSALLGALSSFAVCATLLPAATIAADSIYWTGNVSNNHIGFASLDGTGGSNVITTGATVTTPQGIAIDAAAGKLYWANAFPANQISFARLDGTGGGGDLNTTGATVSNPQGVAIDPAAGKIYWPNFSGTISFARLDGTGGGDLDTTGATVDRPFGVTVDPAAGRIYWANFGGNKISFARLDGTGGGGDLDTTGATVAGPTGVAIDSAAGRIYWTNFGGNKISFARLDGTGGGDLNTTGATAVQNPFGVAIDPAAGRIYWANSGNHTISFARLDGTGGGGDLNTTGADAVGLTFPALLLAPRPAALPLITGSSSVGATLSCSQGTWAPDLVPSLLYQVPESFAFQWSRNGSDIPGATQSSLVVASGGDYRCRVTAQNHAGPTAQTSGPHTVLAPASPRDTTPPLLRSVSLTHIRFRVGRAATAITAAAKRRPPAGTRLRFTSNEAGKLSVLIERTRRGRPAKRLATLTRIIRRGKGTVALSGRIAKKPMAPGTYRLTITAKDGAGNVSKPARRTITILRG
jgi:DNA-binding beta-propeller fold protein YncE